MSRFLNHLTVTEVDDERFQVAYSPFMYESDLLPGTIVVPLGFYTDFASVPRWMPIMYSLLGDTAHEPAVIHDWLYYMGETTRENADDILLEAMKVKGMPMYRAYPIYWGVRVGGWAAWNQHRKDGHPEIGKFSRSPNIADANAAAVELK